MFSRVFVTFPYGVLGQVCYLIVSILDLCILSYFGFYQRNCLHCYKVSDLRYQSFRVKKGDVDSSQLSPYQDTLMIHVMQANYQACIWKRCLK